jgi:hypothetical protein
MLRILISNTLEEVKTPYLISKSILRSLLLSSKLYSYEIHRCSVNFSELTFKKELQNRLSPKIPDKIQEKSCQ